MAKKNAKTEPRDAQVTALRDHSNQHGEKYAKAKGDKYVHPRPQADIDAGLVELTKGAEKTA